MTSTIARRRHLIAALALVGPLVTGGGAAGQEKLFRSQDAVAGQQVRLGMAGNVSQDCKPGPLPEVKVLTPPKNGQLAVRDGKAKPGSLQRCPALEVPARGVFYTPNARYTGSDEVAYEVRRPDGRVQVHTVRITVSDRPKPGGPGSPARENTDL